MYRCEDCGKLLVPKRGVRVCRGCGELQSDDEQLKIIDAIFEAAVVDLKIRFREAKEVIKKSDIGRSS